MLDQLFAQLPEWLNPNGDIFNIILQVGLLALVLLIAPIVHRFALWQIKNRIAPRIKQIPRMKRMLHRQIDWQVFRKSLLPLIGYIIGTLTIQLLMSIGRPFNVFTWALPFLLLWFAYRFIYVLFTIWVDHDRAQVWINQFIRPIAIFIALTHASGLLDEFLELGFRLQDSRITLAAMLAGAAVLILFVMLSRTSRQYLGSVFLPRTGMEPSISAVVSAFVSYIIVIAGLMIAFNIVGINFTTLTVIFGGLSVGIGFGMQDIISNFISGFVLMFERSVSPGDMVQIEDKIGWVQEIGIRSIRIKTIQNVELIVPNSQLMTNVVTNYTRAGDNMIRLDVDAYAHFSKNPRLVSEAIMAAATRDEEILDDPAPYVAFSAYVNNTLNLFTLEAWTLNAKEYDDIESELRYKIWEEFEERGLNHPIPRHDVHLNTPLPGQEREFIFQEPRPSLSTSAD